MRASVAACLVSFITSAFAYSVITPSSSKGWTNDGPQVITWSAVSTDANTFTPVLVNENKAIWPQPQVLAASVNRDDDRVTVNAPGGGWPTGIKFRVNFVKNEDSLDTIYAQSDEFDIKPPTVPSASLPQSGVVVPPTTVPTTPNPNPGAGNGNQAGSPSPSADNPLQSGNGALPVSINGGIGVLIALTASLFI